jgi:hypothetical protein
MAVASTFSVSKKGFPEFEVSVQLPENLDDPRWREIVSDYPSDVHDLALRAWVINAQASGRQRLDSDLKDEDNLAAVQQAVSQYQYGARSGGFQRPLVTADKAKDLKFSPQQMAALKALGVKFEDTSAPAEATA